MTHAYIRHKNWRTRLKHEALVVYSGKEVPACSKCGISDETQLSLDHLDGGGADHRRVLFPKCNDQGGWPFYAKLKRAGWPDKDKMGVKCMACNSSKKGKTEQVADI